MDATTKATQGRSPGSASAELKEPCGSVRTKKFRVLIVSPTSTKLGVKWKKSYNNFFVYLNIKDNILHGENEVRM